MSMLSTGPSGMSRGPHLLLKRRAAPEGDPSMVRRGQNPAKFVGRVARPERITVAVLTYIPFLSGFHREALDVLRACLSSLWSATDVPHDLLAFDNGSGPEAREFLLESQSQGRIQYLLLSDKNLGK